MVNITKAKQELKLVRDKINGMNSTQLSNLFKPFPPEKLRTLQKALDKAIEGKKQQSIVEKEKEIQKLTKELATLKSNRS